MYKKTAIVSSIILIGWISFADAQKEVPIEKNIEESTASRQLKKLNEAGTDKEKSDELFDGTKKQDSFLEMMDYYYKEQPVVEPKLKEYHNALKVRESELERKLMDIQGLLRKAEEAATKAKDTRIRLENIGSARILREAIAYTEKAFNIARTKISALSDLIMTYGKMRENRKPVGIVNIVGNVRYRGMDGKLREVHKDSTFKEGDTIITDRNSSTTIVFPDGAKFRVGPNSHFIFADACNQRLDKGIIHFFRVKLREQWCRERRIETGWSGGAVVGFVRGTEFDLETEENGLSYFTLYDGKMDLTVEKEIDWKNFNRWWEGVKETAAVSLDADKTLKVDFVQGSVKVQKGKDAPLREISGGYSLEPGESLVTGKGALVCFIAHGGFTGILGEETTLQTTFKKDTGEPLYLLREGTLHLNGDAGEAETKPLFLTPNTFIKTDKAEFDIKVDKNKVARITPYSGSLTIEATIDRLEETEIDRWWDEIYR